MSRAAKPRSSEARPSRRDATGSQIVGPATGFSSKATLVRNLPRGTTPAQDIAEMTAEGCAVNALVTREWTVGLFATPEQKPGLTELVAAVEGIGDRVADGIGPISSTC